MLCGVCWEVRCSGVPHAWWGVGRNRKEKAFFLDFQNDASPNTSNGLSQVLVVHSQFYGLFEHPPTAQPAAQDLDAVPVLIPTISLLRLTCFHFSQRPFCKISPPNLCVTSSNRPSSFQFWHTVACCISRFL
jgi:hypothetical protein